MRRCALCAPSSTLLMHAPHRPASPRSRRTALDRSKSPGLVDLIGVHCRRRGEAVAAPAMHLGDDAIDDLDDDVRARAVAAGLHEGRVVSLNPWMMLYIGLE